MLLEVYYEHHKDKLVAVLSRYSGDSEASRDAVQEAFLKALKNRGLFAKMKERAIWSWIYTTAKNSLTDEKRRAARNEPYNDSHDPGFYDDPTNVVMIRELLHKLPPNLMHIVSLKYFGGLNSSEIGRLKGIPPATVRSQLRAALSILRKYC